MTELCVISGTASDWLDDKKIKLKNPYYKNSLIVAGKIVFLTQEENQASLTLGKKFTTTRFKHSIWYGCVALCCDR